MFRMMKMMNRLSDRKAMKVLCFAVAAIVLLVPCRSIKAAETLPDVTVAVPEVPAPPAMPDPVDTFLSQSAFIGNSVGEGLTMYNNSKGKAPLGNAVMLTRVSYSFYADSAGMTKYLPRLNGVPMRAAQAVKNSGVSYVFVCMGTNDLVGSSGAESAYAKYQQYLAGIMAENPFVTIFVESCTPTRPGSNVSNDKVTQFNAYMQAYCDTIPNMYYVDIATPLKGADGYLSQSLSSDGSVHLTMGAYAIWANTVRAYITNFLLARTAALRQVQEDAIVAARQGANENMKLVEDKKMQARAARLLAEQEEREAEEAAKKDALLNVPDEITLMRTFASARSADSLFDQSSAEVSSSSASSLSAFSSFAEAAFRSSL